MCGGIICGEDCTCDAHSLLHSADKRSGLGSNSVQYVQCDTVGYAVFVFSFECDCTCNCNRSLRDVWTALPRLEFATSCVELLIATFG